MQNKEAFLGHSRNGRGTGIQELLKDHIKFVAARAKKYSSCWRCGPAGEIAGMLHDLAKYGDQFQARIRDPQNVQGRDHWSLGALFVASQFVNGLPIALAIMGHHIGLTQLPENRKSFCHSIAQDLRQHPGKYTETNLALLIKRLEMDVENKLSSYTVPPILSGKMCADMLDIRMIFSALVDADFVETEAHFNGDANVHRRYRPQGPFLNTEQAIEVLNEHINSMNSEMDGSTVSKVRQLLHNTCIKASKKPLGLFTLTAPTGAGKTLAMLSFALKHAKEHGLRKIILVMPFLNIIDQTARIYMKLFSKENGFPNNYILEDHSLAELKASKRALDSEDELLRTRAFLSENWDAPIVLTTTVKFFESLHENKPSRCRRLHQLAKSVILFDEAQSIPPHLVIPTLSTLSRLADPDGPYGSSVVFSTATQPAFDDMSLEIEKYSSTGWCPREIVENSSQMFADMSKRVRVSWREDTPISLEDLANELCQKDNRQSLCILNLKRHAAKLAELLYNKLPKEKIYHLSSNMCPAHRLAVLDKVNKALNSDDDIRLISTQCIEAGVDISFQRVFRALAPLESIAQAAGRCNRHHLPYKGIVTVFVPEDEKGFYPKGYGEGISTTKTFLTELRKSGKNLDNLNILNSRGLLRNYFKMFYSLGDYTGDRTEQRALFEAIRAGSFEDVAVNYRLIPGDMINVLVPYCSERFEILKERVTSGTFFNAQDIRQWVAEAREFSVSIYRPKLDSPAWQVLQPIQFGPKFKYDNQEADWVYCLPDAKYDSLLGLKLPKEFINIC
ncbi:MAG: CRISPR-associated helicase Cas3' [Syntrophales bacterium]|nr:CRISPR-associated helicase Cas3' [Syntrophales bacterium]MDY0043543.1 CRISPR-associated helicase Cas3' [Syntrophales bacterium]